MTNASRGYKRTTVRTSATLRVWLLRAAAGVVLLWSGQIAQGQVAGSAEQAPRADQSIRGAVLKGKAPVNRDILRVTLPKAEETTLDNGLHVLLLENHKVPTFSMQMVFRSGGLADPPDHRGLASFTASLLREGTKKRSSREIAEQVEMLGGTLSAGSGLSSLTTNVSVSGLIENIDSMIDIFADVIREPAFPQEEVEKFKNRILSQLQMQRAVPQFLAQERFNRAIYSDHPAGLVEPPVESIKKTSRDDLAQFHTTHYRPNNAMLAIVGDVRLQELLPKIRRAFSDWKAGEMTETRIPLAPDQQTSRIYLIDRPRSVQTVLLLGNLGIERTDPDYFNLLVMNRILGGGPAARLFLNLREDKGYTYGASSFFSSSKFRGVWVASSEVRIEVTDGAMREFMNEFKRIREEAVSTTELEDAKRALVGNFALSLEEPQTLLQNVVVQKLYNLPADYWDTYPRKVAAVTAQDIQRVAQRYVNLEHLQIVAVSDASKVRDVLAKFGAVEAYDAEGRAVDRK